MGICGFHEGSNYGSVSSLDSIRRLCETASGESQFTRELSLSELE